MQYLLLIYSSNEGRASLSDDERNAMYEEYAKVGAHPGVRGGAELQPATTATTVRVRNDETLTTDGPFSDTKEVLGGYFLLEADDLDEAIELAAQIPAARSGGAVEVRPIVERPASVEA
jgi:hypothetical protein